MPHLARIWLLLGVALSLSGCDTVPNQPTSNGQLGLTGSMLTTPYSIVPGVNPVVVSAAAIAAINALLPNWSLQDSAIGQDKYRISLEKKTFSSGGGGEAEQLFKYRAGKIAAAHGYSGYQILTFTQGLHSGLLGTQQVAQGTIQCYRTPPKR